MPMGTRFVRLGRLAAAGFLAWAVAAPAGAQPIPREFVYVGDQILAYQANFLDVPPGSLFYTHVNAIANLGITSGCGGGLFCPEAPVTREAMAIFLLMSKEGPGYAPPPCSPPDLFADVPASSPYCPWIEDLARRGVVGGCGGGNYCPGSTVTREQMAVFLLLTLEPGMSPPACAPPNLFTDVHEGSPFCRWIEEAVRRGITGGCGPGTYCPTQPVSRGQMAVFLTVTFTLPQ
jgi:hypothetical protein